MLTIRYLRSGRTNSAFFRIVLTEKSKPCDSGFIKVLGWYNPHTKESSLDNEAVLSWVDKGASVSNSVAKLLITNGVKHKNIKFVPDAPRAKKKEKSSKGGETGEKPKAQPETDEKEQIENKDVDTSEKETKNGQITEPENSAKQENPAEPEQKTKLEQPDKTENKPASETIDKPNNLEAKK